MALSERTAMPGLSHEADGAVGLDGFPDVYLHEFAANGESDELVVVLSSTVTLHKYIGAATRSVLYVADPSSFYFLKKILFLADAINALLDRAGIAKIVIVGGSKGGYAAVLLAALCARRCRTRMYRCLAFSAHTRIYPINDRLNFFPSYRLAMRRTERSAALRALFDRYGDLKMCQNVPNTYITLVYGENYPLDRDEAAYLSGFNIRKYPVPFQFHSTAFPFILKDQRRDVRMRTGAQLFERLKSDPEASRSLPATPQALLRSIEQVHWLPSMSELIEEVMAR